MLLKRDVLLKKKNEELLAENKALAETERELRQKVELLEQRVYVLKASAGKLEDTEKLKFEKKIREYVKTIDKCLLILNK